MSLINQASLVITPNAVKEGVLYSVIPNTTLGDMDVVRATTATLVNSAGLIEDTPYNLLQQSQTFENASWGKNALAINTAIGTSGIQSNVANAPNGTLTADRVNFLLQSDLDVGLNQNYSLATANQSFVGSIYVKGEGSNVGKQIKLRIKRNIGGSFVAVDTTITLTSDWVRITSSALTLLTNNTGVQYIISSSDATNALIWGAQLVTGTSAKEYFPTTNRLNVARLDYTNSSCPSILVEPQRTNIFPKSQTTSTWTFTNISRTANNGISPDGTQNADLLFPTTSGAVSFNSDNTVSSLVVGQPFICSFFIKLNTSFTSNVGANTIDLRLSGSAVWSRPTIRVNLQTGGVTNITNSSYISSTNYGNGWYRITFGATPTGTGAVIALQPVTGTTLDGGSFYIWGLQGENNSTNATSYIPTVASTVTRNADVISKTGISSLIGQTEGTIFTEINFSNVGTEKYIVTLKDVAGSNVISFRRLTSGEIRFVLTATTSSGTTNQSTSVLPNGNYKIAYKYISGSIKIFINGSLLFTLTPTFTFGSAISIIELGNSGGSNQINDSIKQLQLYKTALTDAECINLTTL